MSNPERSGSTYALLHEVLQDHTDWKPHQRKEWIKEHRGDFDHLVKLFVKSKL